MALDIDKYLFSLSNGEREELVEKENTQKKRDRGVKYYTKYTFTTADGNKYLLKCEAIQTESDSRITEHPYFLKKIWMKPPLCLGLVSISNIAVPFTLQR